LVLFILYQYLHLKSMIYHITYEKNLNSIESCIYSLILQEAKENRFILLYCCFHCCSTNVFCPTAKLQWKMLVVPLDFVFYMRFLKHILWPKSLCRQDSLGSPKFDVVKEINFNVYFEYFDLSYSYSSLWLSLLQKIMSY
jgi:hypothetical protein